MRRIPLGSLVLATLLVLLAGCGGSGSSTPPASVGPDPAALTPRGVPVYVEALVRPQGQLVRGALAAARKVSRVQRPGAAIVKLLDKSLAGQHLAYARDIAPWLGPRAGVFFLRVTRGSAQGAALLSVRDHAAVEQMMARQRASRHERPAGAYRGVAYDVEPKGDVDAIVGDFFVSGTKRGFQAAVDAWKGGPSLAGGSRFQDAVKALDSDRLAFAYADPVVILDELRVADAVPPGLQQLLGSAKLASADPITLSLAARADQIALQLTLGSSLVPTSGSASDTVSLGDLPGDSWLALATPPLGPLIRSALDQAGAHAAAAAQVRAKLGLDLDKDLLSPLGGLAAFARGTGVLDLGGGLVLRMGSPSAAQTLMTRIEAIAGAATGGGVRSTAGGFELQAGRLPQPIVVRAQGERIAVGYGSASASDLLAPKQRFGQSSAGKAAIATLGDGYTPALVVIAPPIVGFLRSLDELQVAKLSPVLPYLSAYRSLAVGTKRDGERTSVRIVAALD